MNNVIDIFKEITLIPRCSKTHKPFYEYIKSYAKKYNYEFLYDETNNILCRKKEKKSKICFQSHYDIVCLANDTIPEIVERDGYFYAKDSTLGADNGIGCAYMLALMKQNFNCEFLFTSDEEIGLIGANGLNFELHSNYLINLDSEKEGEICVGCAGGADIIAKFKDCKIIENTQEYHLFEISVSGLIGGHSGLNIHEKRENAIELLIEIIKNCDGSILDIVGGERTNSIPVNAKAIIATKNIPKSENKNVNIVKIDTESKHFNIYNNKILEFLQSFKSGALSFDDTTNTTKTSQNLATIQTNINEIEFCIGVRSISHAELEDLKTKLKKELLFFDFEVDVNSKYSPWDIKIDNFTNKVLDIYKKHSNHAKLYTVHAGLETALFSQKYPNLSLVSIGPNIYDPHSKDERVEIASINNVFNVVLDIAKEFNS